MSRATLTRFAGGLSIGLAVGCADELVDPQLTATATATVPPVATGGAPADPGPRVRDVFLRNPFGVPYDNLLADGDFELSISRSGSGQYGFRLFNQSGQGAMAAETGGLCKSGLRCARLAPGDVIFGTGAAAPNEARHYASIWMKRLAPAPNPDKPCNMADVFIMQCNSFDVIDALPAAVAPDERGWCQFTNEVASSKTALCLYAEVLDGDVLADNAVLLPAPPREGSGPPPLPSGPQVVAPRTKARMETIRDIVRGGRRFGRDPAIERGE